MEAETSRRYELQTALHNAIANQEFRVQYQPIVDGATLRMSGVEGLIRWDHARFGLVTPDVFLPMAQQMGIMPAIDIWVLGRACHDALAINRSAGMPVKMHVNVSAATVARPDFVLLVEDALAKSALPADMLVLEITEQSLIVDETDAGMKFAAIRSLGVKVAIDDFGTGYNGLCYLKKYELDSIKIDRGFIHDVETSSYSRGVCSGLMALARNLNLRVVAEGVETTGQAEFLATIGVDEYQGYLYGRPVDLDALLECYSLRSA